MQVPSEGVWLAYDLSGEVTSQLAFGSIGIYNVFLINGSTLIAGWFIRENTVKIDNFAGTPISGTPHTVPLIKVMVQSVFPVNNTVFLYIYVAQTYVFPIKIVNTDQ